ncbi:alpha/beta hydrolase [Prolixibacteraceae bacterium Z1-6]|uniref:Alpha/beta hydrolase n=1 Tax=Draconibacterium aestuarii TaxID=2998507 RepID=A0A9X3J4P6_9BACT|nr:alpha/beta hydrolase [Prolixibacteraceae bacterium Z1-6]
MKTFIKLLFFMACMAIMVDCEKEELIPNDSSLKKATIVNHDAPGLDHERFVTMKETGLTVHYRIIGKGPIDMIFIPGWTNPLTVYTKQFEYFRDKARCIYIDLPGTGMSNAPSPATPLNPEATGPQYTMELMAEAVYAVAKKEGLHSFVGVGFSMGPCVLSVFERHYPGMIEKLVVIDGGIDPWPTDPVEWQTRYDNREANYLEQLNWDLATKQFLAGFLVPPGSPDDLLEFVEYFYTFPSDILANTSYHSDSESANELVEWNVPILCFFSGPAMDYANMIYPGNQFYEFSGGGHCIQWVFHEDINPIMWEFVKDRPGKKY